jgi:hypothetical protein
VDSVELLFFFFLVGTAATLRLARTESSFERTVAESKAESMSRLSFQVMASVYFANSPKISWRFLMFSKF